MKKKFGVSLEDELLEKFDHYVIQSHFSNRSEAISYLIKEKMKEEFVESIGDHKALAIVSICFDHHKKAMGDILTKIQHDYLDIITSSMHIHVDHENCAEMVICSGPKKRIMSFYQEIREVRSLVSHNLNFIYNYRLH